MNPSTLFTPPLCFLISPHYWQNESHILWELFFFVLSKDCLIILPEYTKAFSSLPIHTHTVLTKNTNLGSLYALQYFFTRPKRTSAHANIHFYSICF